MRTLLTRLLPKASLNPNRIHSPPLTKNQEKAFKEPLTEVMQRRQAEAGASWPQNLRIEPIMSRRAIGKAPKPFRATLKKMLVER
ncbi:hypothetical protein PAXINDRAFT_119095 [Paxillus involutus ATCC 200175]|uniref:Uncharacterized protein n=1 Tax=Paxillus involutus ATCC 200175 TaxID=664439 RepID=A0A0C9TTS6_PAXIN|nr:hypothetical protein PAXINDRAFT_119095 [Paxillus involutus ATCC 200175]